MQFFLIWVVGEQDLGVSAPHNIFRLVATQCSICDESSRILIIVLLQCLEFCIYAVLGIS